jgi:transketolase
VAIVDRNGFQANLATEELIPLEPLPDKFAAFGWETVRLDGHSFAELEQGLVGVPIMPDRPTAIIADTMRGQGLPSIAGRADRWFCNFTHPEIDMLLEELEGTRHAIIESDVIVAR